MWTTAFCCPTARQTLSERLDPIATGLAAFLYGTPHRKRGAFGGTDGSEPPGPEMRMPSRRIMSRRKAGLPAMKPAPPEPD